MSRAPAISSWPVPPAAVFEASAGDTPTAGDTTFLGCLGFLTPRLPRIVALRQYGSPVLPVAKATAMSPSVNALVTLSRFIVLFRVPCRCVPDELGHPDDRRIVWIYRRMPCMHDAIGANALSERSDRVDRLSDFARYRRALSRCPSVATLHRYSVLCVFLAIFPSTSAGRGVVDSVS